MLLEPSSGPSRLPLHLFSPPSETRSPNLVFNMQTSTAIRSTFGVTSATRVRDGPAPAPWPAPLFHRLSHSCKLRCSRWNALQGAPGPTPPPRPAPPGLQGARKQVTRAAVEFYGPDRGEQQRGRARQKITWRYAPPRARAPLSYPARASPTLVGQRHRRRLRAHTT